MKGQRTQCLDSFAFLSSLIFFICVGSAAGLTKDCSSSCGGIESIICISNRTILEIYSGQFYVTNISYEPIVQIRVVNVELVSGKCAVPSRVVLPKNTYPFPYYNHGLDIWWVGFFNCSEKIPDHYGYELVPCLNGNSNNGFIYVKYEYQYRLWAIEILAPSCSFLSEVPIRGVTTGSDIFQQLKMGFVLEPSWSEELTVAEMTGLCLRETMWVVAYEAKRRGPIIWFPFPFPLPFPFSFAFLFDVEVVACLYEYKGKSKNFVPALVLTSVLILLINIAYFVTVFYILGRFVIGPLCIFVFLCHKFWKMRTPMDKVEKFLRFGRQNLETARYSYLEIVSMTGHFKVKLGQGGFGSVYRGNLLGGYPVAVKMLGNSKCNGDDFISEVSTISRIRHLNIVKLLGFCSEGTKRALVYEFMSNGSLDKYIFSSAGANRHFTKEKLNEIALGVARGIDYLHRGCDMRILHFDVKPQNILLDHNFDPKVSDFGLARLYSKEFSFLSVSVARGTIGYIAPELVSRCFGAVSTKSDVYSFGMLLMEMAGARRNYDRSVENSSECYYPSWIYDRLQKIESGGHEICVEIDDMERKLCKVGLACIQTRASDRPPMSRVVEMLEADVDTLPMPPKPFSSSSEPVAVVGQSDTGTYDSELSIIAEE